MVLRVYKKDNFQDLLLLYPDLAFQTDSVPVLRPKVFSLGFSPVIWPDGPNRLFLVEASDGLSLTNLGGFLMFLSKVGFMQDSKIESLRRKYVDKDKYGHEKIKTFSIPDLYRDAVSIKFCNRTFNSDADSESIVSILEKPLSARIKLCSILGIEQSLSRILDVLTSFFSKDGALQAKTLERLSAVMVHFNRFDFNSKFSLTGNSEYDLYSLLSYFGG